MTLPAWLAAVNFNTDGLIPAIAQDYVSGRILMMAWMNTESLQLTAETQTAVYFSRSRGKLWHKGESSGHTQRVHDIRLDCDADVIVLICRDFVSRRNGGTCTLAWNGPWLLMGVLGLPKWVLGRTHGLRASA